MFGFSDKSVRGLTAFRSQAKSASTGQLGEKNDWCATGIKMFSGRISSVTRLASDVSVLFGSANRSQFSEHF
jgi:hypothetical protein